MARSLASARRFRATLCLAALAAAACDRGGGAPPTAADVPEIPRTAADSARMPPRPAVHVLRDGEATGEVPVLNGAVVVVTVASASSGRCESVAVTGAFTQALFPEIGTCRYHLLSYGVGQSVTLGPYTGTGIGILRFTLPLVEGGRGLSYVTGEFPHFTVHMDDGMADRDYDDVVLSVRIVPSDCNLLADPGAVTDSLLMDPAVQQGMKDLWRDSNPLAPLDERREQGGYIARETATGELSVVPYASNLSPAACTATLDGAEMQAIAANGKMVVGYFHTHPFQYGDPLPPGGTCGEVQADPDAFFADGPSKPDKAAQKQSPWPSYIVDRRHIHRLRPYQHTGAGDLYQRDQNCAKG